MFTIPVEIVGNAHVDNLRAKACVYCVFSRQVLRCPSDILYVATIAKNLQAEDILRVLTEMTLKDQLSSTRIVIASIFFFVLLAVADVAGAESPVGVVPRSEDIVGTWQAVSVFKIAVESGHLNLESDNTSSPLTMIFNVNGSGSMSDEDGKNEFSWTYTNKNGILSLTYQEYRSESYVRTIDDRKMLLIEMQDANLAYVGILSKVN
jgi:hypothetical protein